MTVDLRQYRRAGINMAQRVMDCGDAGHILLPYAWRKIWSNTVYHAPDGAKAGGDHGIQEQLNQVVRNSESQANLNYSLGRNGGA